MHHGKLAHHGTHGYHHRPASQPAGRALASLM